MRSRSSRKQGIRESAGPPTCVARDRAFSPDRTARWHPTMEGPELASPYSSTSRGVVARSLELPVCPLPPPFFIPSQASAVSVT
jgi:hypothetical protein